MRNILPCIFAVVVIVVFLMITELERKGRIEAIDAVVQQNKVVATVVQQLVERTEHLLRVTDADITRLNALLEEVNSLKSKTQSLELSQEAEVENERRSE